MDKITDNDQLFSMDIDAYLYKVAVFSQRSILLFSSELVREAIKRGAKRITVKIDRNIVEISDDGNGMDPYDLKMIGDLKEDGIPIEKKESAVVRLKSKNGAGMLAVFAVNPKSIKIETVSTNRFYTLSIRDEDIIFEEGGSIAKGTRIQLLRHNKNYEDEVRVLREYIRRSDKKIVINGVESKSERGVPRTLVSVNISDKKSGAKGVCGIPVSDRICKIWFTDNGIISKRIRFPPLKGLIFHAILETGSSDREDFNKMLIPIVHKLYYYLAKNFTALKSEKRDRVEELLFLHTKSTGIRKIINQIKPFKVFDSNSFIGLEELIKLSSAGKLYVVNSEYKNLNLIRKNSEFTVELTPRQIDFILNHLKIPVKFIEIVPIEQRRFINKIKLNIQKLKYRIQVKIKFFMKKLDADLLWNEEKIFLKRLSGYFSGNSYINDLGYGKISFYITKGIGLSPIYFVNNLKENGEKEVDVLLRRGSGIVQHLVKLYDKDEKNFEIVSEFIMIELKTMLSVK